MDMAPLEALILGTPNVIREWSAQVFVPLRVAGTHKTRDTNSVSRINDYAIEMMCLEAEWIADLTRDAVRKNIVPGDALRMWVWGRRPRLKSQIRDNPDDAKTFSSLCRILADHLDELDIGIIEAMKPAPVGDGQVSWQELRLMSRECFPDQKWLPKNEVCKVMGISPKTLQRWERDRLVSSRPMGGERCWNLEALYFARVMKQFWAAAGRRQNHDEHPLDILDEVLGKLRNND